MSYAQIPHEEEDATSAQHDSTRGKAERETMVKMNGHLQEGQESEWNGEGCSG